MTRKIEEGMLGKKNIIFFLIVISIILIDRITKYFAFKYLVEQKEITPFFSLYFTTNTGAAFGILKGETIILTIISVVFIILILYNIKDIVKEKYYWAAALILGGAVSNLYDRIFYGFVIDFIAVPHFSVFNIADSAITLGAIGLFVYLVMDSRKDNV